jgi:DMSO/TMAO reductase YedYZ molybdopterin-dependent catalytic subunit
MSKSTMAVLIIGVLIIGGACVVLLSGSTGPSGRSPGGTTSLPAVEIRSYQGKDLSSVNDFRENSIKGPQQVNISDYRLSVGGLVNTPHVFTYDAVLAKYPHYSKVVTLYCVEGWHATILWEGIPVKDIVRDAGPDPRATTIIFTARDGYTTSFPLEYIMDHDILMAYRMNNVTLPAERGYPFQLVAEDKWGYKWIKWIEKIELSDDASYKGYWEQRGYTNSGDLNKFFQTQ